MSLKLKLATSISAFFLVLAMLVTGVFAARNLEFNFGGTINFEGVNGEIDALVTGTVTGTATPITLEDISIEQGTETVTVPLSWQNMDLTFAESRTSVSITITIQNRREDRALNYSISMTGIPSAKESAGESNVYGYIDEAVPSNKQSTRNQVGQNGSRNEKFVIFVADRYSPIENVNVTFNVSLG